MSPRRVQLHRTKGWRMPEGCISVARPSKWGNRYRIVPLQRTAQEIRLATPQRFLVMCGGAQIGGVCTSQEEAHRRSVIFYHATLDPELRDVVVDELGGHDLACYCDLPLPCHVDVLLRLANPGTPPVSYLGAYMDDHDGW